MSFFHKDALPKKLNICLVGTRFQILSRASDHSFLWPIARGLAKLGHKVTVISTTSPMNKPEITRDGVQAFYLMEGQRARARFQDLLYQKFYQLHQKEPFHIVHSLDRSGYRIGVNKKKLGVAVAYDIEATQIAQLFSILGMRQETVQSLATTYLALTYKFLSTFYGSDRWLLKTADGVFVTNPQQRILLERYYLYPDYQIHTIPYGIEVGDLSPKENSIEIRRRLGLADNAHIVLTLSDMTEVKEMRYLLQAFERLAIKKPHARLVILGNGPMQKDIEFEVLSLALGNHVLMPGAQNAQEILDYIAASDVYVNMSSRSTGFEPSMIEAMAQKKVIIGSEVGPISYVVEDGVDGFLLRPADVDSLGQLLIEVFSQSLPVQEIGDRARRKVLDLFNPDKMLSSVMTAYQKILLKTGRFSAQKEVSA